LAASDASSGGSTRKAKVASAAAAASSSTPDVSAQKATVASPILIRFLIAALRSSSRFSAAP
jgi:hypothetical protein